MQNDTQQANRSSSLIKSAGIYAIGVFGSRLMMFLLVPLYSFFIAPAQYGYFDLCFMTVMLLFPLLSLQLKEGAFRFLIEADEETRRRQIITFTARTLLESAAVLAAGSLLLAWIHPIDYLWLTAVFAITFAIYEVWIQIVRGLGHNAIYAEAGILSSALICVVSMVLVAGMHMDITGIFIGNIVGRLLALGYIELRCGVLHRYLRPRMADLRPLGRGMLRYSIPLIFVSLIHWTLSGSNRFFIEHDLGLEENGLYAIAQKFAAIFEAVTFIGYQTWQEMALRHYNDSDRDKFLSRVLNAIIFFLTALVVFISFGAKLSYHWIVSQAYQPGQMYLYPLITGTMFGILSMLYDVAYQCAKQTHRAIWGLIMAAAISLVGNYVLIRAWGIYGALLTVNLSYLSLVVYRMIDTRRYFVITLEPRTWLAVGLMLASGIFFYLGLGTWAEIVWSLLSIVGFLLLVPTYVRRFAIDKIRTVLHPSTR